MTPNPKLMNPDIKCRNHYIAIGRDCRRQGLIKEKLNQSLNELILLNKDKYYLKKEAYLPTGIALGCPFPDKWVSRRLWHLAVLVEKHLKVLLPGKQPNFAHVPPDCYHITLLNRSHYQFSEISLLSEEEKNLAAEIIAPFCGAPIVVNLHGLVLTPQGHLIALGFPSDDRLYDMRDRLIMSLPTLSINPPDVAHVKLGHVLVKPPEDQIKDFLAWLAICGYHASARLSFSDLFTPTGRIPLCIL